MATLGSYLVTGGTGTLGEAVVRTLLRTDAKRVCVLSRDEHKQFEMRERFTDKRLRYFIGDVRDLQRLRRAFAGIDCVIHAAAMKQVEASEFNPFECVKTNVFGAQNVMEASLDCDVKRVLAISTDKASAPSTLYGATKLCAERMFIAGNKYAGSGPTRFSVVRFGNIALSRGSVIPKWKRILANGLKVVPVTDPDCTRYWITAEDAARHVLQYINRMQGGEVFIPEMPAFRIGDLATAMDASILITGLGRGERLHEDGSEHAKRLSVEELRARIA